MIETIVTIPRKPGDCKSDLVEVLETMTRQTGVRNMLIDWMVDEDEITLKFVERPKP